MVQWLESSVNCWNIALTPLTTRFVSKLCSKLKTALGPQSGPITIRQPGRSFIRELFRSYSDMKPFLAAYRTAVSKSYPFHIKSPKRASWQPPLGLPWPPLSPFPYSRGKLLNSTRQLFLSRLQWDNNPMESKAHTQVDQVWTGWVLNPLYFRNGICMYYLFGWKKPNV